MVDGGDGHPGVAAVAVLADIAGLDVRRIFPRGISTVVAIGAVATDIRMAEVCRNPANGGVAIVTAVAARQMSRVLADCGDSVMT